MQEKVGFLNRLAALTWLVLFEQGCEVAMVHAYGLGSLPYG